MPTDGEDRAGLIAELFRQAKLDIQHPERAPQARSFLYSAFATGVSGLSGDELVAAAEGREHRRSRVERPRAATLAAWVEARRAG